MKRDAPRIGVEILIVTLILGLLGGALGLVVLAHRRNREPERPRQVVVAESRPTSKSPVVAEAPQVEAQEPSTTDVTDEKLRPIKETLARQKALLGQVDARAAELEKAAVLAQKEADRWKSREQLILSEVEARQRDMNRAEAEVDQLAFERDVLAQKRDEVREKLEKEQLRARDGVAVLPYKGANGTWRRPIAIECRDNSVVLQPGGPTFTMAQLTSFINPRRSPLVLAVAKTMVRARSVLSPDGAAVEPYIVFVVRPDGVRPYYAARVLLEPLGISYGYELADADWDIEYPDLDDPKEWGERSGAKRELSWPPPAAVAEAGGDGSASRSFGAGRGRGDGLADDGTEEMLRGLGRRPGNASPGQIAGLDPEPPRGVSAGGTAGLGSLAGDATGRGSANSVRELLDRRPGGGTGVRDGSASGNSLTNRGNATPSPGIGDGRPDRSQGGGWGQRGRQAGMNSDGGTLADLDAISRGEAGDRPIPNDGRIPWHPGLGSDAPSFDPTPPSDPLGGMGSNPAGNSEANSGLTAPGDKHSGRPDAVETYREAIARNNGLVSPRSLSPPPRSIGAAGTAASPSAAPAPILGATGTNRPESTNSAPASVGQRPQSGGTASTGNATMSVNRGSSSAQPAPVGGQTVAGSGASRLSNHNSGPSTGSGSSGLGSANSGAGRPGGSAGLGSPSGGGSANSGAGGGFAGSDPFASRALPMTISCEKTGVTIYPGGRSISFEEMERDDSLFSTKLKELVQKQQDATPELGLRPRVKFLVRPGGEVTYLKARWQVTTQTNYPTAWQVVDHAGPTMPELGKP